MRLLPAAILTSAAAIGATVWNLAGSAPVDALRAPKVPPAAASPSATSSTTSPSAASSLAERLAAARRSCRREPLDELVRILTKHTAEHTDDREAWHTLAAAHLERVLHASHLRGLTVGAPSHSQLPATIAADLDAAHAALLRARTLGDDSADLFRIEAALGSQRITGLATALQWNGKVQQALQAAGERAGDDPHVQVAIGLRKLLAPKLFGHDPAGALQHFEFAAAALPDDERPAVFAAMACHLQKQRQAALDWLAKAVARNPANTFARVVLQRLRADEPDPFGRDVTPAEAAAK